MANTEQLLLEHIKKIDDVLAGINGRLAQIDQKITEAKVPVDKVFFLDEQGNKIHEGNTNGTLPIPKGTKTIIANGHLDINGEIGYVTEKDDKVDIIGIDIYAKDNVTARSLRPGSQITAGGEVKIKGKVSGDITAGGNFVTEDEARGKVAVKGSAFANIGYPGSEIFALRDVVIMVSSLGEITAGRNISAGNIYNKASALGNVTAGTIEGSVTAMGDVTAKKSGFDPKVTATNIHITDSASGTFIAEEVFSTNGFILGKVSAGDGVKAAKGLGENAELDTPRLYIHEGTKKPKNFPEEKTTIIPRKEWKSFIPPEPNLEPKPEISLNESAKNALADFRKLVGNNYTNPEAITSNLAPSAKPQTQQKI